MTRDELRLFARNGWPVVQNETGAHGEIVYPYIREIKVIYASPEEIRRGYPRERMAVVVADASGHSFTEVMAKDLRIPENQRWRLDAMRASLGTKKEGQNEEEQRHQGAVQAG